ncbi:MAG: response regulator, partial [Desulfococcaceae bacterium]|nr:response regulator [Desulfococcaceae bacterium]
MSEEKILIVEDCESTANYLIYCLEKLGYLPLSPLRTGEEALDKISELKPDLILMDVELEGKLNGIETAALLRKKHDIPILYLTSHSEDEFL